MKTREFTFLFEERKKKERRCLPQKLLDHCLTIRAFFSSKTAQNSGTNQKTVNPESKRIAIKSLPSLAASVPDDDVVIDEPLSIQRGAIADALEKADSRILDEVEQLLKDRGLIN